MVNSKVNLLVDLLMVIVLVLTFISGSSRDRGFHSDIAIALAVLVALHLILHWRYIINIPKLFIK
jgi:hypothetical protein